MASTFRQVNHSPIRIAGLTHCFVPFLLDVQMSHRACQANVEGIISPPGHMTRPAPRQTTIVAVWVLVGHPMVFTRPEVGVGVENPLL